MKKRSVMLLICFLVLCFSTLFVIYLSNSDTIKTSSGTITEKVPSSSSAAETFSSEEIFSSSSTSSSEEIPSNSSERESKSSTSSEGENRELSIKDLCEKSPGESIKILESFGLVLPEAYASDPETAENSITMILQGLQEGQFQDDIYPFSYTELVELAKRVKAIAIQYDPETAAKYDSQSSSTEE